MISSSDATSTKVIFRPGENDLAYLRCVLGEAFDPDTLRRQGVGEAIVVCDGRLAAQLGALQRERLASLRTELSPFPHLRDARTSTREYAKEHYKRTTNPSVPRRRPRVYDTFARNGRRYEMLKRVTYHVVHEDGKWKGEREGAERASVTADTNADVVRETRG